MTVNAVTPEPPSQPAPTRMGGTVKPKRWYHQWTQLGEPTRAVRKIPWRWRAVMRVLPWRVRMTLLRRWSKR